ncbi:Lrp/AsnC family transcriptional regulator [Streptomyces sp. NBC_01728]|uniref:Lrp/AsnC family transcriptional regulator n=1 Tax=unclassified Streptomyces TaxID=2593676 RepID=UPI00224E9777|nr:MULTISPECIES: Lrp/AsnC family transcriptional regulator [unclassified Streptomyces]MCX4461613.1 Lrp/AsnC family transcriptional regulator [Streptomyces sp. NBC_01719]MCX4490521.1 Lrp/AsnC family transcriptional regulator [Streptomyces sp. NBC_01728]MCX4597314.1 Lrp/AsnC family transcriptional regulator [Streptomyces sp. NBC_01549]
MSTHLAQGTLAERDQRLVAALQYDGRISAERASSVLGYSTREVQRRLKSLTGSGTVRVIVRRTRNADVGATMLRIKVLRGKLDAITSALAEREDIPFVDVSASGDEISAVLLHAFEPRNRLIFQQLPATSAVTAVTAQTVLHVFCEASDWRLDVLTAREREVLARRPEPSGSRRELDATDEDIVSALELDGRLSATAVAHSTGHAESTVRRRLVSLFSQGRVSTQVLVDPQRLGMGIDANIWMEVPPDHLDAVGRSLARHPAVHGAVATTGRANLCVAVWFRDMQELYCFLTQDLSGRSIVSTDTVLVGQWVKRAGLHR